MELDLNTFDKYILEKFLSNFNKDLIRRINQEEKNEILYILKRLEEIECNHKDQFGNFEFSFTSNDYNKPYLDYFVISLLDKYNLEQQSLWGENPFALILTHDVDLVNKNHFIQDYRCAIKHLVHNKGFQKIKSLFYIALMFRNILFRIYKGKDSLWDFEKWMEIENKYSYYSTYYFFIRSGFDDLHVFDCDFDIEDKFKFNGKFVSVKDYMQKIIKRGDSIGLHGSYLASENSNILKKQLYIINTLVKDVITFRNHYLHFDCAITPEILSNEQIEIDTTLGFNRSVGFRAGTSFPFYFYNINMKKPILEVPQIIMDSALFLNNSLELDLNLAKKKVLKIMEEVERVKGILTVNFHPDKISKPYFFEIYNYILTKAKEKNALNISITQVKEYLK